MQHELINGAFIKIIKLMSNLNIMFEVSYVDLIIGNLKLIFSGTGNTKITIYIQMYFPQSVILLSSVECHF